MRYKDGNIVVVKKMSNKKHYLAGYVDNMKTYAGMAFEIEELDGADKRFFKLKKEPFQFYFSFDMVYPTIRMV